MRIVSEKRGHARGVVMEVLEPSPMRIAAPCPHFTVCGGCHYQHIPYSAQLEFKRNILREQLERLAGISSPPVLECIASPFDYSYRNNIQFHLSPAGKLSYLAAGGDALIEINVCYLPEPELNQVWQSLDFDPGISLERIGLRQGSNDEILLTLESSVAEIPEFTTEMPLSAVLMTDEGEILLSGNDHLTMEVHDRSFRVSAGSFFQVNSLMAGRMVDYILDTLPLDSSTDLLELYCGVGLFSAFLAPRVRRLAGVEVSPSACRDFAANLDEFDNVELYEGTAGEVLPALDWHPQVILADPPRAGLEPAAMEAILRMKPAFIGYISCDPSTLARDARKLLACRLYAY